MTAPRQPDVIIVCWGLLFVLVGLAAAGACR